VRKPAELCLLSLINEFLVINLNRPTGAQARSQAAWTRSMAEQILLRQGFSHASVNELHLIQRGECDVYRARTGPHRLVLHVGAEAVVRLLHYNLLRLEEIDGGGLPRAIGWAAPRTGSSQGNAVLVTTMLAGVELTARTFSPAAWNDLCSVLLRMHGLPAEVDRPFRRRPIHDALSFPRLAAELEEAVRTHHLPIPLDRLRGHLDRIAEFTQIHSAVFKVPTRLIHTDLSRSNVLIDGPKAGIVDWLDLGPGDYAYDLASLKFAMDSVRPRDSATLLQERARLYRVAFDDSTLELRMRFFLALVGLVRAHSYALHMRPFPPGRAWRVRTCFVHSEAQWRSPLRLDGIDAGAPAVPTDHQSLPPTPPLRALFYMASNRRRI
jgi:aminoglycoside phosphotransferase (APT) family kinase protein